jgi:hypothetical protein
MHNRPSSTPETNAPTAVVERITPSRAEQMLAANTGNRRIRERKVAAYARAMAREEWTINGEAIVFASTGRLINGQHRLEACKRSGASFDTFVVYNVHESAYFTMDTGAKRTLGDALRTNGESFADAKAAALSLALRWEAHVITDPTIRPSITESLDFLGQNPTIFSDWHHPAKDSRLRVSAWNVMWWMLRDDPNPDVRDEFRSGVFTGANLSQDDPRFALRRFMHQRKARRSSRGALAVPQTTELALIVKAWNAYAHRKPVLVMLWKPQEKFPALLDSTGDVIIDAF